MRSAVPADLPTRRAQTSEGVFGTDTAMLRRSILFAAATGLLAGCAQMPVEQAEAQCVQSALYGGGAQSAVTVGIGTGYGGWGGGGWGWGGGGWGGGSGAGIAMSTTLPVEPSDPESAYNTCVRRKSGQMPVTPFGQRPEVQS